MHSMDSFWFLNKGEKTQTIIGKNKTSQPKQLLEWKLKNSPIIKAQAFLLP